MPWVAGQSGNPGGRPKHKPFQDALRMEAAALEGGEIIEHPRGSLRWNAQMLLLQGDVPSINALADRLDGKVPTPLVGDDEHPGLVSFTDWLAWMKSPDVTGRVSNSPPTTTESSDSPKSSPTAEPEKP